MRFESCTHATALVWGIISFVHVLCLLALDANIFFFWGGNDTFGKSDCLASFLYEWRPSIHQQSMEKDPPGLHQPFTLSFQSMQCHGQLFQGSLRNPKNVKPPPSSSSGDISGMTSIVEKSEIPNLMPLLISDPGIWRRKHKLMTCRVCIVD